MLQPNLNRLHVAAQHVKFYLGDSQTPVHNNEREEDIGILFLLESVSVPSKLALSWEVLVAFTRG